MTADAPISFPSPANSTTFCTYSNIIPGWKCDAAAICGTAVADAWIIYYGGDQWVAWVDCGTDNTIDDCEVMPRTLTLGSPDTEALQLVGTGEPNMLALTFLVSTTRYNLQPVPGSGDVIHGDAVGLESGDTIHGSYHTTAYTETLYGGPDGDIIYGNDGADVLLGQGEGDLLEGGEGDDHLEGGGGADSLWGQAGNDVIYGGAQGDSIAGGDGNDKIDPGDHADTVCGDNASNVPFTCASGGSPGNDWVRDSAGTDVIDTQEGTDLLCDGDADTLEGGGGNEDEVFHSGGYASLSCGSGTDDHSSVNGTGCEHVDLNACTVPGGW